MQNLPFFYTISLLPVMFSVSRPPRLWPHVRRVFTLCSPCRLLHAASCKPSAKFALGIYKYNKCTRARRFDLYQERVKSSIKLRSFLSKRLREWKIRRTFAPANEERGLLGSPRRHLGPAFCN